jgi:hypothetical protein
MGINWTKKARTGTCVYLVTAVLVVFFCHFPSWLRNPGNGRSQ